MNPSERPLILALDLDDPTSALTLAKELREWIGVYKIGLQLFTRGGPDLIRAFVDQGHEVFLDLKFHDIPNTVHRAVQAAAALQVRFLTVHASGGSEMLTAAVEAAAGSRTQILAVTVLTSLDDDGLREIGFDHTVSGQVVHLARLAHESGVPGLVCSPQELELIRSEISDPLVLVTPGIRPATDPVDDQKRTLSAREAILRGANYLVVGRPILQAADRVAAAQAFATEIRSATLR